MTARILVVDDVLANVKLLEAKLSAEYYSVLTAMNGFEALRIAQEQKPDLILLDVMMPQMDGFDTCRKLKDNPETASIPVVMVTALDQPSDRVKGLAAGADDFLTKPPNDLALFARVRSLLRVKMMMEELQLRGETFRDLGMEDDSTPAGGVLPSGKLLLVDDRPDAEEAFASVLRKALPIEVSRATSRPEMAKAIRAVKPDIFVVNATVQGEDGLRFCLDIRSAPESRHSSIILLVEHNDYEAIARCLDLGANDYVMRPIDENELVARVKSQLLRKHYADKLRENVHHNLRAAITDPLTGLYNRRYAAPHLESAMRRNKQDGAEMAALLLDIDRFKSINDTYGHGVGDEVLKIFANRINEKIRSVDLAARIGGEEFLILLPETRIEEACEIAERLRAAIAGTPFPVLPDGKGLPVTVA